MKFPALSDEQIEWKDPTVLYSNFNLEPKFWRARWYCFLPLPIRIYNQAEDKVVSKHPTSTTEIFRETGKSTMSV